MDRLSESGAIAGSKEPRTFRADVAPPPDGRAFLSPDLASPAARDPRGSSLPFARRSSLRRRLLARAAAGALVALALGFASLLHAAETTVSQFAEGATWSLHGETSPVPGGTYTYTITRTAGTQPGNEYAGFHVPSTSTSVAHSNLGSNPMSCGAGKYFCASFSPSRSPGIWNNIQDHHTIYTEIYNNTTITATLAVTADTPIGTTISFGAIENNGRPRSGGLLLTVSTAPTKPPDPTPPTLVSATTKTLTIEWTHPGDGGSPLIRNYLHYRVHGTTEWSNWYAGETPVTRAAIGDLQANTAYDVRVSVTNANGSSQWVEAATAFSTLANTPATGAPTITGTAEVGQVLTASTTGIADADGLPSSFSYQWVRVGADGTSNPVDIPGAIDATYTLTDDDEGKKVKVEVRFVDILGGEETRTSAPTATVTAAGTNAAPVFPVDTLTLIIAENTAADTNIGAVIPEATDADSGDTLEYSMEGTDAGEFTFDESTRQIKTKTGVTYDFEAKSSYSVTIRVSDGIDSDTVAVTITITDVDEQLTVQMTTDLPPPLEGPFTVRFRFSETVTGFSSSDIATQQQPACTDSANNPVSCNPTIAAVQTTDDRIFTTTVTPQTDQVAHNYTLTLTVGGGAVRSSVGNELNEEGTLEVRVAPPGVTLPISSLGLRASAGNTEVRLNWNQPTEDGGSAIIRYEYRFAAAGEDFSAWENVIAGTHRVTVGVLINGREYMFEVRAVNALGKGGVETVMAMPVVGGGGGGFDGGGLLFPPEAPASLMAMPGDGAVRLEWSPPASDGGTPILRYEYRLKEGRGAFGEWTPIDDSAPGEVNASGYTVGGLLNGTVYIFELRAVNLVDEGRESEAVEVAMPLDPAYWSNFLAGDLQGIEAGLERGPFGGGPQSLRLRFGAGLRFEESELDGEGEVTGTRSGSYGYRYTSQTTGELRLDFDGEESCELRLTFRGEGAGSYRYRYRCGGAFRGQGSFALTGLNRVPEITGAGVFEVAENTTRVGQLEAVDWDEEDEVTGYGIAGGADGALFAVEEETGELRFRTAPDYETPGDVASEDPQSPAADNEYIVVVEVRSGEGERERRREQAIRVRVRDVEMEEAGEDEKGSLFIPVILSSAGRNQSFFTSELTLTNRGEQEVRLDYIYTAEPGGETGTASDDLAAGRQRVETDALDYLRGLGIAIPETGNQLGTLRVEVEVGSEVEAVVRTTTVVSEGRAGLAYLGVAAEEGFNEAVYLCGLRQNAQDRSNVAFQNMGAPEEGAITLRTTAYSGETADASPRMRDDVTLRPGEFHQYNQVLDVLGSTANGYVKVERVEGAAPFYAYGVINDQANSDGSFVFPVAASWLEGTAGQTLPVIVETSEFRSELTVTNFSDAARTLDFQFVAERIETTGNAAGFSMTLEAGRQEIIPDLVDELRRQGETGLGSTRGFYAGPLFAVAAEGDMSGIVIGARTGSEGGGGQYSVFYNAVPFGEAFSREAWVDGLQQNEENRSNLALVNTGEVDESASVFHLEIYDGETGLLAETVVTKPIPARGWHQINGILGSYAPETRQGYIRIEKVSGQNPFLAYGVVNDGGAPGERSGDGAYLPARE